ncbi:MAG: Crp/Fnr family transcriptional regulator [Bacteroidetes bacterium]|nr:MAG: Crp/Fnr family transcriptional regulator [Bacteroidota bacterium]
MQKKVAQPECEHCQARYKSIFCSIGQDQVHELDTTKHCQHFKKGQVIFSEGSRPHGLYCVNSGKVKLTMLGDEGREQIVHLAKDGDIMGYRALLSNDTYSLTATALEDASVCFIPRSTFFGLVEKNASLSLQLIKLLSSELRSAERQITDLAQKPVRERLAEALLFIKETYGFEADGQTLNVTMTREEIANIVGTATETVIRLLSDFKTDKLIGLNGKKIKVLDLAKLIRTANMSD